MMQRPFKAAKPPTAEGMATLKNEYIRIPEYLLGKSDYGHGKGLSRVSLDFQGMSICQSLFLLGTMAGTLKER